MAAANQILTDLSDRVVLFGLGGSAYDWNDPFGRLFLQTLVMVAEFEAKLSHLRTREGMATREVGVRRDPMHGGAVHRRPLCGGAGGGLRLGCYVVGSRSATLIP
ncbi:recombinase family protein [Actinomadura sp. NPDC023710]|uniref:recombinase family protein n=1 Tax=Actinomadura sp. NPDC023710 TaxID=3158219 RepID=UPI0033D54DAB